MNLRSRDAYRDRAWDWGFLNDCFGSSNIRLSDVDGIVERHSYFLVIEAKPSRGAIGVGQRLLLDALSQVSRFTVLVLYGEPNKPEAMQHWPGPATWADEATIRAFVSEWYRFANRQPRAA